MSGSDWVLAWHADPLVVAGLAVAAGLYLTGLRRLPRGSGSVPADRPKWFVAAMAVLTLALVSPLATAADERFSAHMVQHLLLTYVAAPFLALSAPVTLALQASSPATRRRWLLPALRSLPAKIASFPVVTWLGFAAVMYLTHFTGIYDASLRNAAVHGVEHALYLGAAVLFWWPVIRRDPVPGTFTWPARLLYLVLTMPLQSFLGLAIFSSTKVLYASYAEQAGRTAALADQNLAGAIMWVGGDVLMLTAIGFAIAAWMRSEARATVRLDARLDAAREARDVRDSRTPTP
jgi:putative copper resistance protein D